MRRGGAHDTAIGHSPHRRGKIRRGKRIVLESEKPFYHFDSRLPLRIVEVAAGEMSRIGSRTVVQKLQEGGGVLAGGVFCLLG